MLIRSYKKNIVEGRGFIGFSIILVIIIRTVFFIFGGDLSGYRNDDPGGYLWQPISNLFDNPVISLLGSAICISLAIIILVHINTKYVLIRRKTSLYIAICALLFSCHPTIILMNEYYISMLFVLAAISQMFSSYSTTRKAKAALEVSFTLALGSLFSPCLLLYLPVFWIGLGMMRSFDAKALMASLFSIICVYVPVFSYFLFTGQPDNFLSPFKAIDVERLNQLPITEFGSLSWVAFGFIFILVSIVLIYNYITSYKDKIKVRALVSFISLLVVFSSLILLLVNINPTNALFVLLVSGSLFLSHFFALAEEKWIVYLFYLSLATYFILISLTFMGIVLK